MTARGPDIGKAYYGCDTSKSTKCWKFQLWEPEEDDHVSDTHLHNADNNSPAATDDDTDSVILIDEVEGIQSPAVVKTENLSETGKSSSQLPLLFR